MENTKTKKQSEPPWLIAGPVGYKFVPNDLLEPGDCKRFDDSRMLVAHSQTLIEIVQMMFGTDAALNYLKDGIMVYKIMMLTAKHFKD